MFVWSYWKTIFTKPSNPTKEVPSWFDKIRALLKSSSWTAFKTLAFPPQFCLPKAEKERYEKEERPESQQEILWRAATSLPLYTRTGAGGLSDTCVQWCCFISVLELSTNDVPAVLLLCSNPLLRPVPSNQARPVPSLLRMWHVRKVFKRSHFIPIFRP